MNLQLDFNYDGKLKKSGQRTFTDDYHTYVTSISDINEMRQLKVSAEDFYCRDELITGIATNLQEFNKENKLASLNAGDRTLTFEFTSEYGDMDEVRMARYINVLRIAIMGETNENFSFAASPYLVRWVVKKARDFSHLPTARLEKFKALNGSDTLEDIRASLNFKDWFYLLMIEADKEGISLNSDMNVAWQIGREIGYGHMGLDQLKIMAQSRLESTQRYYEKWFPPIQLRKVE
jgi:hypothetical protein